MSIDPQRRLDESVLQDRRAVVADFLRRWYRVARRLNGTDDIDAAVELVGQALRDGLPPVEDSDPPPPPDAVQLKAAAAVVAASGFLDPAAYADEFDLRPQVDPVRHYVDEGWRRLLAPSLRFDAWSYWSTYLDPTDDRVMPLLHYLLVGRHQGLPALPERKPMRPGTVLDGPPRRICLYAAYDRDGLVDDHVVHHLTELSRHADVYYLADGVLEPGELDKLAGVTQGAWSIPHGTYDFGSFSRLARDLVGWDVIDTYDELVLANDSCFLLRPLDDVFARMQDKACDWWALQATSMEHDESYQVDDSPIPLPQAKQELIGPRHWRDVRYLHLSSYFLVYRKPVMSDPGFRFRFDTVCRQDEKMMVVHKYEVGISRYLLDQGFDFETYLPDLHAFHPLYSRHFFDLVEQGFPVVKRNYLGENPRHVLGLDRWQERLRELTPQAPIELMEANLQRVSPVDRLHEAYLVRIDETTGARVLPSRSKWGMALRTIDKETPTYDHWWAFATNPVTGRLDDGVRAVFEQVREDPSIHKVVLARARRLDDDLEGERVTVLPVGTVDGQSALVRCRRLIVDTQPNVAFDLPLAPVRHDFVHTGLGLSPVPTAAAEAQGGQWRKLFAMATSSQAEALGRTAADPDLSAERLWLTGLPRHDLLVSRSLPADLAREEERLAERLGGRHLVLWWQHATSSFPFDQDDVQRLARWVRDHDAVLGVRDQRPDRFGSATWALRKVDELLSLSPRSMPWSAPVLRQAAAVVTDLDPAAADAMVLGIPLLALGRTLPPVDTLGQTAREEGFAEPLTVSHADGLLSSLDQVAEGGFSRQSTRPAPGVVPLDGQAAWRLVQRLRSVGG